MNILGTLQGHASCESKFVRPRHVEAGCPPGYESGEAYYPVIYRYDGQNPFGPIASIGSASWEMDKAITRLQEARKLGGAIVVGVWKHDDIRWREYRPQTSYASDALKIQRKTIIGKAGGDALSDAYLKFLIEESKPFIDGHHRTVPNHQNAFGLDSSMGGLISLYANSEYPAVFYGTSRLSANGPAGEHE